MKKKIFPSFSNGFTLIELMVVIAIIGILMAAGIVAFTNTQKSARDARRRADVKALGTAMEEAKLVTGAYPTTTAVITTYMSSGLPLNPSGGGYTYSLTTTKFCICATLDIAKGNVTAAPAAGACTFLAAPTGTRYCIANQQ